MKSALKKAYLCLSLFILAAVTAVCFSWYQCPDKIGFGVNTGCILLMLLIILAGFKWQVKPKRGILALCEATDELINAKSRLHQATADPDADLEALFSGDQNTSALFQLDWLSKAFGAHRAEAQRLYRDTRSFQYVDISDHMNDELLSQIGFSSLNDLISGAMTGLGILGTFIGLMIGLRNFDPSTAESMMNTIPPLIDGIKVAFLTSIFGVIFSIVFNFIYRNLFQEAEEALESFNNEYYQNVLPKPENDGFTQLIQYQQEQAESMSQLAEQISLTMANALTASVVPTFEKIEKTIDQLSDRLAKTQSQNMEKIADEFVQNMNQSMGNQLQHLGENIQKLCQWQDTMVAQMASHMDAFQSAGSHMDQIAVDLDQSISAMDTYVKNMESASSTLQHGLDAASASFERLLETLEQQQKTSGQILAMEDQVLESMHTVNQLMTDRENQALQTASQLKEEVTSTCTALQQSLQQSAAETSEILVKTQEMMEQFHSSISGMSKDLCENLKRTADETIHLANETVKASAAETAESIRNAANSHIGEIQGRLDALNQTQAAFVEHMHTASDKLIQASDRINETACKTLQESAVQTASLISDTIKASSSDTFELIKQEMASQISQIQANMNSINQTQNAFIEGMKSASQQLTQASKQIASANVDLTANLDKAMSRTYQEFDRQLSDITLRLSGTIIGIKEITEVLPRSLKNYSDQTQKITTAYLSTITDSQQQLLKLIQSEKESRSQPGEEN